MSGARTKCIPNYRISQCDENSNAHKYSNSGIVTQNAHEISLTTATSVEILVVEQNKHCGAYHSKEATKFQQSKADHDECTKHERHNSVGVSSEVMSRREF